MDILHVALVLRSQFVTLDNPALRLHNVSLKPQVYCLASTTKFVSMSLPLNRIVKISDFMGGLALILSTIPSILIPYPKRWHSS